MAGFTVLIRDSLGLLAASVKTQLQAAATYVGELVTRYVDFKGTLDIEINIRPHTELTFSNADGLLPALGQIRWDGSGWVNDTLSEAVTGIDRNTSQADAGATIYLAKDGTIRNYGIAVWFDPAPAFDTKPAIPAGTFDIIGVLTHEVFHTLGLYGSTRQWQALLQKNADQWYFTGSNTQALYGGPLPLAPAYADGSPPDHYGNLALAENRVKQGLMFQFGNYESNRLDIGRIDLAILQDLGVSIKTYAGLPLFELLDYQTTLSGSEADDVLYGNYQDNLINAGAGNDLLVPGAGRNILDGGTGLDTVVLENPASAYTLSWNQGVWTTASKDSSVTDTLANLEFLEFADRRVDISSAPHESFTGLPDSLWHFFIVAFNAAPGVTYMNQLAAAYNAGNSIQEIVNIFISKTQFTNLYPSTLSHADFARQLVNNVVRDSASDFAKAKAGSDIGAALDAGQGTGEVIFTIFGNLAAVAPDHPLFGDTAARFANQVKVARYYSDTMDQSTTDPATLQSVIRGVDAGSALDTDAAIVELIGQALLGTLDTIA